VPSEQHTILHRPAHALYLQATDCALTLYHHLGLQSTSNLTCMPCWIQRHTDSQMHEFDVQAPMGSVAVAISLSNVSRATLTPQQLLFTPSNWSEPQLVRTAAGVLHSLIPSIHHPTHSRIINSYNETVSGLRVRYLPALYSFLYEVLFWQSRCLRLVGRCGL